MKRRNVLAVGALETTLDLDTSRLYLDNSRTSFLHLWSLKCHRRGEAITFTCPLVPERQKRPRTCLVRVTLDLYNPRSFVASAYSLLEGSFSL